MMRKAWQTRRARHTPRYTPVRTTVTMRARALKSKRSRPKRRGSRSLLAPAMLVLAVPLLAFGAYTLIRWLHRSPEYIVEEIRVEGAKLFTPEEIADKANLKPGRPILDYPIARARRALLSDPMIHAATVTRQLPNTLVVRVIERVPIARLGTGGKEFLVDDDGFLLKESDPPENLPLIKGVFLKVKDPKPGIRIKNDKLTAGLQVLRLCQVSSIPSLMPIEHVDVHNLSNIRLRAKVGPKTPNGTVFMLGDSQFGQRLARLEKALQKMSQPIRKRTVDLRLQRVAL